MAVGGSTDDLLDDGFEELDEFDELKPSVDTRVNDASATTSANKSVDTSVKTATESSQAPTTT